MTMYEKIENQKKNAQKKAIENADCESLYLFWCRAAIGFQRRLDALTIEEASVEV